MLLYRYRRIESALLEIDSGTFHFASREELNDPIEGYVRVYWEGDKAAWEGLFRNYICSVCLTLQWFLLGADEERIRHRSVMVDRHKFDGVPYGELLHTLGEEFVLDDDIQKICTFYGDNKLKVYEKELVSIFRMMHAKAFSLCVRKYKEQGLLPEDMELGLREKQESEAVRIFTEGLKTLANEKDREVLMKVLADFYEDTMNWSIIQFGINAKMDLYGKADTKEEELRRRNWIMLVTDYPMLYVAQLKELIYPEAYIVCFSKVANNSAMWGNYANNHKGICLIYEAGDGIQIEMPSGNKGIVQARKVEYGGELIERNFFETLGRCTIPQVKDWLTGTEGVSSCFQVFAEEQKWRDGYWAVFVAKNYRKIKAWAHEEEYRMVIDNTFYEYTDAQSRNLRYDTSRLKGIIFGINTSEYDKKQIVELLIKKSMVDENFEFYQAEYDEEKQVITNRKIRAWGL